MTVRSLSPAAKDEIARMHKEKTHNQKELATIFDTSERTINRVLQEKGLATAVPRIKGEAYRAMQLLKQYGISVEELEDILRAGLATKSTQATQTPKETKADTAALFRPPAPTPAPTFTPTVGAWVRIADAVDEGAYECWGPGFVSAMRKCLGGVGRIVWITGAGIEVHVPGHGSWTWMEKDISLVEPAHA